MQVIKYDRKRAFHGDPTQIAARGIHHSLDQCIALHAAHNPGALFIFNGKERLQEGYIAPGNRAAVTFVAQLLANLGPIECDRTLKCGH